MKQKQKKYYIIGLLLFFLFVLIGTTVIATKDLQKGKVEKRETKVYKPEQTITCVREDGHDGTTEEEEVCLQNGEAITRRNSAVWYKAEPKEKTCEYYKLLSEGINGKSGVTSSVTCDEKSGRFTATYVLSEVDRTDLKLNQFDFVDSQNKFDVIAWKVYMEQDRFVCEES